MNRQSHPTSSSSSTGFSAELYPEPLLQRIVLLSGFGLTLVALLFCLLNALPGLVKAGLFCIVYTSSSLQLVRLHGQDLVCVRLFPDGSCTLRLADGRVYEGNLESDSVILQNLAWLRFRSDGGGRFLLLLRGDSRRCSNWRRLQVITRHIGAVN